jgi:small subunit ribosomal protein S20
MPQHKSAEKRVRVSERRRTRNKARTSAMKNAIKRVRTASTKTDGDAALKKAVTLLDKLSSKGVIHRNKASNQKSRLTKAVNKLK